MAAAAAAAWRNPLYHPVEQLRPRSQIINPPWTFIAQSEVELRIKSPHVSCVAGQWRTAGRWGKLE
ncbi:hypothetical protein TRAPUB_12990 [Trametes pubescens]|uniref:Uncharacterized protein n=1 Tax=Trametes pubescens TaxID=154538 RepID=A0A1M2VSS5_TRAPU|nr:hypothetical protein TRAPUB_12990 [Trametes pubescens]